MIDPNLETIPPFLSSIAAVSLDGIIGINNDLPWTIPEDTKYFRDKTRGKKVLMGRKTLESMGGIPLPHRLNYILSRDESWVSPLGTVHLRSIEDAIKELYSEYLKTGEEIFVIGGEAVYLETLPYVKNLYLTEVDLRVEKEPSAKFQYSQDIIAKRTIEIKGRKIFFQEIKKEERKLQSLSFRFIEFIRSDA